MGVKERPAENPPPGGNPGKPPWPGYPNPMPPGKDWPTKLVKKVSPRDKKINDTNRNV